MKSQSLERHIRKLAIGWATAGLALTLTLSASIFILLVFKDSEATLRALAASVVASYRTDLLSGDVRAVELQIKNQFDLRDTETAFFLDANKKPWVADLRESKAKRCDASYGFCRDWSEGLVRGFQPIYFDSEQRSLWGYLYIERRIHPNWALAFSVVLAIVMGMAFQVFGFYWNLTRAIRSVSSTLSAWATRLSREPKMINSEATAPFSELESIEHALSGLTREIEALENAARQQGALATLRGVGHDILNPVSRMKRILGLLEMSSGQNQPVDSELLSSLKTNLKRLSGYAEQLKHIYRAQYETASPINTLGVNCAREAAALIAEYSHDPELVARKIQLELDGTSLEVAAIPQAAFARILENLISNAVQATRDGSEVLISIKDSDSRIVISVSDQGPGVPTELRDKVFESGFTTKANKGTGLGLYVVKQLVEQYSGNIHLKTNEESGATFVVSLPIFRSEVGHDLQAAIG